MFTILLLLALPIHAKAQNAKQLMFSKEMEATTKEFFPIFCQQEMPQIIKSIENCYQQVMSDDSKIRIGTCLIADGYVEMVTKANRKEQTYSKELTDFINQYNQRQEFYFHKLLKDQYKNLDDYYYDIKIYIAAFSYRIKYSYTINELLANPDIDWIVSNSTNSPEAKKVVISALKNTTQEKCKHNIFYYYAKNTKIP